MKAALLTLPRIALVSAALAYTAPGWAVTAGTLLFAQPGVEIIDAAGVKRVAKQGDKLQEGERLLTPPNAIAQIGLADGSLLGLRPGSELKVELPAAASDQAQKVVTLLQGSIRVIGAELMEKATIAPLTLKSGIASMQLRGADIETELVRPEVSPRTDAMAPGTYSKLLVGSGVMKSGDVSTALAPRQVAFLGAAAPAPTLVTAMPTKLLAPLPIAPISTGTTTLAKTTSLTPISTLTSTSLTTSKLLIQPLPIAPLPTTTTIASTGTLATKTTTTTTLAVAPTTVLAAPTTVLRAPTTTLIAPIKTTYIAPIKTTYVPPITTTYVPKITTTTITTCTNFVIDKFGKKVCIR